MGTEPDPSRGPWTELEWEDPPHPQPTASPAWTEVPIETEPVRGRRRGPFERLFGTAFGRLLLPAIVAQSVLIGGGYATGREVVEFGGRFGALGWIAVLTIFVGFTIVSILVYEFARIEQAYDYKSFVQALIGPAWPLFDLIYAGMAVLVIAVMASATGSIIEDTLGLPAYLGILAVVAAVAFLTYHGARLIEAFKTVGTLLLYVGYAVFGVLVLTAAWPAVGRVFAAGDVHHAPDSGIFAVVLAGVLYVGYNLAIYPAVLFTLHRQRRTRDSVIGGLAAGFTMTLPFLVTYLALLAFYDDDAVIGADVPWLAMLDTVGGPWVVGLFGVVMGWTLLETSVGLIHAILDRVERAVADARRGTFGGLTGWHKALLGGGALFAASTLAQVGIVDLVAAGYTWMGYAFLALFALPLLTVGTWRIVRTKRGAETGQGTRRSDMGRTRRRSGTRERGTAGAAMEAARGAAVSDGA